MAANAHTFSYTVESARHEIFEHPVESARTVPIDIFRHASVMQALCRHLIDREGVTYAEAGRLLGRSPKSVWASRMQTGPLPASEETTLQVPLRIFTEGLAPLEALVSHLRDTGLRNREIARLLGLSEKTTSTAYRRAEVKR